MNFSSLLALAREQMGKYAWLSREYSRYPMHPIIQSALDDKGFELANPTALVLEWPHVSEDGLRIAYTRTVAHGESNRQTVTAIGRYLSRHFTGAKSSEVRDLAVLFNQDAHTCCEFTERSVDAYVDAVQSGPASCMKWSHWRSGQSHPYQVYDPAYGWHMAVEKQSGAIWGRCLCLEANGRKLFVRSYRNNPASSEYSGASTLLDAWLINQGYARVSSWPHFTKLALVRNDDGDVLAPYLDGDLKHVTIRSDYLMFDTEGDLKCDQTSGIGQDEESREFCEGCNEFNDEDYMNSVGINGDQRYCDDCINHSFRYAYSTGGRQCYVHENDVISVGDDYYDSSYLEENDIVHIDSGDREGDYAKRDDTLVDALGNVWHTDEQDENVVMLAQGEHANCYYPLDRTWVCVGSNERYSDTDLCITVDGLTYAAEWAALNLPPLTADSTVLIPEDLSHARPLDGLVDGNGAAIETGLETAIETGLETAIETGLETLIESDFGATSINVTNSVEVSHV